MRTLGALILIGILGFGVYWYVSEGRHHANVEDVRDSVVDSAHRMKDNVKDSLSGHSFNTDDIKDELARTGRVVRQKAKDAGNAIADATADARITGAIKAKMVADTDLSALSISVNTTGGTVTLSGTVSSPDYIAKAMKLAMEPEGVKEVVSTLQVKSAK